MPMITMYAVANIDSSLWGTRSVGEVKNASVNTANTATHTNTDIDADVNDANTTVTGKAERRNSSRDRDGVGGGNRIVVKIMTLSRWLSGGADEEAASLLKRHDSSHAIVDSGACSGSSIGEAEQTTEIKEHRDGKGGDGHGGGRKNHGRLSLRAWKFVILASWGLANIGLTASYLRWGLSTLAALGFFSQSVGLGFFIVAAWVEMRLQRSSTIVLPPQGVKASVP